MMVFVRLFDGRASNFFASHDPLRRDEVVALPLRDATGRGLEIDRQLLPNFLLRVQLLVGSAGFVTLNENLKKLFSNNYSIIIIFELSIPSKNKQLI
jgi:hypothetical protein